MKSKFLLVYVGVDGDKLADYARREMAVVELGTYPDSTDPITEEIEAAAFSLLERLPDGPRDEAVIAVIPMFGSTAYRVKASKRVDLVSQIGGVL